MKHRLSKTAIIACYCLTSLSGTAALAAETNRSRTSVTVETNTTSTVGRGKLRQDQARFDRCERREQQIRRMLKQSVRHFETRLEILEKLSDRVEDFAEDHNRKPANFSALVSAVSTAEAAADTGLNQLRDNDTFDCDAEDPKAILTQFHTAVRAQRDLMRTYHTAVRNLIVGVKSAQGQESSGDSRGGSR
jgi:hypothetical protein